VGKSSRAGWGNFNPEVLVKPWDDEDDLPDKVGQPTRGRRVAVVVAFLLVMALAVEMISITFLGTNSTATFSRIDTQK